MEIILASTSPFRKELLERLGLGFQTAAPEVDETALPGEAPEHLVARLAEAKAKAVQKIFPNGLIIGSDQVAVLDNRIITKPSGHNNAVEQLINASGRKVTFLTGLCLFNARTNRVQVQVVPFSVIFRDLQREQIETYLHREQPYNCAGSFKSEGLGIALFKRMEGDDPTALIGLPLITLVDMLANEGVGVL
jgi:septum formation protein